MRVQVDFEIGPGLPPERSSRSVELPTELFDQDEKLYYVRWDFPELCETGDFLIVEPRDHAQTGELVLALRKGRAVLGHWWAKHGKREVRAPHETHTDVEIIGVVNQVVRGL
jgi:SOS-response transcriptional repressor LexA